MTAENKIQIAQCKILDIIFNEVMRDSATNTENIDDVLNTVTNVAVKTFGSVFAFLQNEEEKDIQILESFFENLKIGSAEVKKEITQAIKKSLDSKKTH